MANGGGCLRAGHLASLALIEDAGAYCATRAAYAEALGAPVYLRPTDQGLVVISLDHARTASMVGVGARGGVGHRLRALPPQPHALRMAVAGYEAKCATLLRGSLEERFALELLTGALAGELRLPFAGTYFVHQEWLLAKKKIDILGVDPTRGALVVIELKKSAAESARVDRAKGGNALDQAKAYAALLHRHRAELYPYFQCLARALARAHHAPAALCELELDPEHIPDAVPAHPPA